MKKGLFLLLAVLGNGLGSALMFQTHLGMSAWGAAASNLSLFFGFSPGVAFVYISVLFYVIAIVIKKKFVLLDMFLSMCFLVAFSVLLDGFIYLIPDLTGVSVLSRIGINVGGMLILLLSISLHLKINLCVHPMDVFLQAMQQQFKSVSKGTYLAYFSAFSIAILFGLLAGSIRDISIGTALLLVFGGAIMGFYDKYIFYSWKETNDVSN